MEEEKNTAAAVDWEEAPNPKHRKRSRKKEPAANAPRPAETAVPAADSAPAAEPDTASDTPEQPEPAEPAETPAAPETVGRDVPIPPQPADAPAEEAAPADAPEDTPEASAKSADPAEAESAPAEPDAAPTEEESASVPDADDAPADENVSGDTPADEAKNTPADDIDPDDTPEERARAATISRTAQLSISQIMAGLEENIPDVLAEENAAPAPDADDTADEDDEPDDTIPQKLGRAGFGMIKWLLLVIIFVLIIAGAGVAWLYRSATPDMLPTIKATFDGQEISPTAYSWHVPVVGNLFKRTYAETLSSAPYVLDTPVSGASPDVVVTPSGYTATLTVTDADKNTLYDGGVTGFRSYLFEENGTYDAKLVVKVDGSSSDRDSSVTGTETWQFQFTVNIKPTMQLCTPSVQQGSVAAVRVGPTLSGEAPAIKTALQTPGFVQAANGWICYLPISWNESTGNVTLTVTADGYTEDMTLSIRAASYNYKDYSKTSQMTSPYIGESDAPAAVTKVLSTTDDSIEWAVGGFVQPFLDSFDTPLIYGMTEYAGRARSERSTNYGYGGRTATNVVIKPKKSNDSMIVPASGRVLLAEDLGGIYGNTVVIEHGAGLKSIVYGLGALNVKTGENVKQGQLLGVCSKTVVAEMRIGTVPINPLLVWRGQCDGLKNY